MILNALSALGKRLFYSPKRPPGPSWTDIREEGFQSNIFWSLDFPLKLMKTFGEVVYIPALKQHLITGAKGFEYILKTNHTNFQRNEFFYKRRMQPLFGKSLLIAEGAYWKHRRKVALPAYNQASIQQYVPEITTFTNELILQWETKTPTKINMLTEMNQLTLKIVLNLFCNTTLSKAQLKTLSSAIQFCNWYTSHVFFIHRYKPTINNVRFFWHLKKIDNIILGMIHDRQKNPKPVNDLLNFLLHTKGLDTDQPLTNTEILAELKTHLLTGHETTACALTWMWYLLAQNPEYREKMELELESVLNGRLPTFEDVPKLIVTKAILYETFRLYPPIWSIARTNLEADKLEGYDIPANSLLVMHLYALHRNPDYWEDPNAFKPERFLEANTSRHPFAYLPFNSGSHTCIASHLAMIEGILLAATLGQKMRFEMPRTLFGKRSTEVKPEPCISLRPHGGIIMIPKIREKNLPQS